MARPILSIRNLVCRAKTIWGETTLLDIPQLDMHEGEILGIVGESGSGKSILAQTILKILPRNVRPTSGEIVFGGEDLLKKPEREMSQAIRGKEMAMIFQDPMASLNPVFTVQDQMETVLREHNPGLSGSSLTAKAVEMLELVKLSDPEFTIKKYPHELSGGMRQRVLIATALCSGAKFLISDEATRALDVTIQAGILKLLERLKQELGLSTLFISSNIALAASVCERIGILYCGSIVELGPVESVLKNPGHFYTRMFLSCLPTPDKKGRPMPVPNMALSTDSHGCPFADFCPDVGKECKEDKPALYEKTPGHYVACARGGVS